MLNKIAVALLWLWPALPGMAACTGQDIVPGLPAGDRATLEAQIEATPFGRGNAWRATRGTAVVDIVGTYHFDDPRHDEVMAVLRPRIDTAAAVLVEAGPSEMDKLKSDMLTKPELMFVMKGATLPELMPEKDWQDLSGALAKRGMPAIFAAKLQPWYATMLLAAPPCMMPDLETGEANGLDTRIIARALDRQIPILALEPHDAAFERFRAMAPEVQVEMLRMSLMMDDDAEDMLATLSRAYFDEDARLVWVLGRMMAEKTHGLSRAQVDRVYAMMEDTLMIRRNESWIPVIEEATKRGRLFVAFGALHLSGEKGVLALLRDRGFRVEPMPFR